jgi:hypothetical protein
MTIELPVKLEKPFSKPAEVLGRQALDPLFQLFKLTHSSTPPVLQIWLIPSSACDPRQPEIVNRDCRCTVQWLRPCALREFRVNWLCIVVHGEALQATGAPVSY